MVFCDEAGEPYKPDFLTSRFKRNLEAAELPIVRFHDLRHYVESQVMGSVLTFV
jgi:integrase